MSGSVSGLKPSMQARLGSVSVQGPVPVPGPVSGLKPSMQARLGSVSVQVPGPVPGPRSHLDNVHDQSDLTPAEIKFLGKYNDDLTSDAVFSIEDYFKYKNNFFRFVKNELPSISSHDIKIMFDIIIQILESWLNIDNTRIKITDKFILMFLHEKSINLNEGSSSDEDSHWNNHIHLLHGVHRGDIQLCFRLKIKNDNFISNKIYSNILSFSMFLGEKFTTPNARHVADALFDRSNYNRYDPKQSSINTFFNNYFDYNAVKQIHFSACVDTESIPGYPQARSSGRGRSRSPGSRGRSPGSRSRSPGSGRSSGRSHGPSSRGPGSGRSSFLPISGRPDSGRRRGRSLNSRLGNRHGKLTTGSYNSRPSSTTYRGGSRKSTGKTSKKTKKSIKHKSNKSNKSNKTKK